jgi:hypothetical protein
VSFLSLRFYAYQLRYVTFSTDYNDNLTGHHDKDGCCCAALLLVKTITCSINIVCCLSFQFCK